jgi:L-fuconolactonase
MLEECIDAHHHLWRYEPEEYPWIGDHMPILRRDYLLGDLDAVTRAAGVTGTIAVQARQTVEETEWLSQIAAKSDLIRAVVGWAPLVDAAAGIILERLASLPKVKGVRHVLHDERDDFYMLREDFNRGITLLKEFELRYDLLIFENHLPQTIEFVDRHPGQIFIVDHVAKPRIKDRKISPWRENLRELSRRENVYCKVSGMVTEADWQEWTDDDLKVYFATVLDTFGPARLMFGSDWPVLTLASSYERWLQLVKRAISALSRDEQRRVLSGTAVAAYGL